MEIAFWILVGWLPGLIVGFFAGHRMELAWAIKQLDKVNFV